MSLKETIAELAGLNSVFEKSRIHYRRFAGEPNEHADGSWILLAYHDNYEPADFVLVHGKTYEEMAKNLRESVDDYYAWLEDEAFKSMGKRGD